jgi:hypothetical protein
MLNSKIKKHIGFLIILLSLGVFLPNITNAADTWYYGTASSSPSAKAIGPHPAEDSCDSVRIGDMTTQHNAGHDNVTVSKCHKITKSNPTNADILTIEPAPWQTVGEFFGVSSSFPISNARIIKQPLPGNNSWGFEIGFEKTPGWSNQNTQIALYPYYDLYDASGKFIKTVTTGAKISTDPKDAGYIYNKYYKDIPSGQRTVSWSEDCQNCNLSLFNNDKNVASCKFRIVERTTNTKILEGKFNFKQPAKQPGYYYIYAFPDNTLLTTGETLINHKASSVFKTIAECESDWTTFSKKNPSYTLYEACKYYDDAPATDAITPSEITKEDQIKDYYPLVNLPGLVEQCTPDPVTGQTTCIKLAPTCITSTDADGKQTVKCTPNKGFGDYLNIIIKLFIGICAVLAMIMIVIGGLQYMTSELPSTKGNAKDTISKAILGLLLALAAFAILNTINPKLLNIGLENIATAKITKVEETEEGTIGVKGDTIVVNGETISATDPSEIVSIKLFDRWVEVNKAIVGDIEAIDRAWRNSTNPKIRNYVIKRIGGYRAGSTVKGTSGEYWSAHGFGIAIDINPDENPYVKSSDDSKCVTDMPAEFVQLFKDQGWGWGGNWETPKDAMHFSKLAGEIGGTHSCGESGATSVTTKIDGDGASVEFKHNAGLETVIKNYDKNKSYFITITRSSSGATKTLQLSMQKTYFNLEQNGIILENSPKNYLIKVVEGKTSPKTLASGYLQMNK